MDLSSTPTTIIIFGATGDLAKKKLLVALLDLYAKKLLPKSFNIVGFSIENANDLLFRGAVKNIIDSTKHNHEPQIIDKFCSKIYYQGGDFKSKESFNNLEIRLKKLDSVLGMCSNKLFYIASSPIFFKDIFKNLSESNLSVPCNSNHGWTRILIEKPLGTTFEKAKELDEILGDLFENEQIFRIDHYLAKETAQNLLAFRFSNSVFEPLWNKENIEKVEIKMIESFDIGDRVAFYEQVGALRDVGQNHILQLLALISMEKPDRFSSEDIQSKRAQVLSVLRPETVQSLNKSAVRGQYEGYNGSEETKDSKTETYFKINTYIDNSRWRGVPFVIESGKALNETKSEIVIYFKKTKCLCPDKGHIEHQNILTFNIQPNEGIALRFWVKKPGISYTLEPRELHFNYNEGGYIGLPDAYEHILYEGIVGSQRLFASQKEVNASWQYISSIRDHWNSLPLAIYKKGSFGPK